MGEGGGAGAPLTPLPTQSSGSLVLYYFLKIHRNRASDIAKSTYQPPILSYLDRPTYLAKGQTSYVIDPYVVA